MKCSCGFEGQPLSFFIGESEPPTCPRCRNIVRDNYADDYREGF